MVRHQTSLEYSRQTDRKTGRETNIQTGGKTGTSMGRGSCMLYLMDCPAQLDAHHKRCRCEDEEALRRTDKQMDGQTSRQTKSHAAESTGGQSSATTQLDSRNPSMRSQQTETDRGGNSKRKTRMIASIVYGQE